MKLVNLHFNRILALIVLCVIAVAAHSQCRYANSLAQVLDNQWIPIDGVHKTDLTPEQHSKSGGGYFKFEADNKKDKDKKNLLKNTRFVQCNDTLYINLRPMGLGQNYERVYLSDSTAYFKGLKDLTVKKLALTMMMGGGLLGGMIGSLAVDASVDDPYSVFQITVDNEKKTKTINHKFMLKLLENHPELYNEYKAADKKEAEASDVILVYLQELGLITL